MLAYAHLEFNRVKINRYAQRKGTCVLGGQFQKQQWLISFESSAIPFCYSAKSCQKYVSSLICYAKKAQSFSCSRGADNSSLRKIELSWKDPDHRP
jgi:hypothetical protein